VRRRSLFKCSATEDLVRFLDALQIATTIAGTQKSGRVPLKTELGRARLFAGCVNRVTLTRFFGPLIPNTQVREIAFPNQFGNYSSDLANNIQRDGACVELRGVNKWVGNGDCSVNLIWAK
jgi:hypothetical protein